MGGTHKVIEGPWVQKNKILLISPGIEDGGMRGLGRVTLSLIDGLAAGGFEVYLLTGAPFHASSHKVANQVHDSAVKRQLDHYLIEGIQSPAFQLTQKKLRRMLIRDLARLFIKRRAVIISNQHNIAIQHQPNALRHFAKLSGFLNFGMFYRLSKRFPRRFRSFVLYAMAKQAGIDVIMTASPYPLEQPFLKRNRIKTVQYVHDVMPLYLLETAPDSTERFARELTTAMRNADYIMTSSQNGKDTLQAVVNDINAHVVYLPCEPVKVQKTVNNITITNKKKLKKGKYFLFMSTLEKRKNVARLIQAFELISSKTDYKLVIVGSQGYGWDEINEVYQGLEPKVQKQIELAGYVTEEDKWSLIQRCGAVIHPSIDEGLGIPVIESLIARKLVISTRLNSVQEFAPSGCVVYIDDPYSIYEIADKLLISTQLARQMAPDLKKGSEILSERFSEHAFALRLQNVVKKVLRS